MAELILHIGGHRTGSTSIQTALHASRRRLRRAGVLYPETGRIAISHIALANAVRGRGVAGFEEAPPFESLLESLGREIAAAGCRTVVISSEEFILTHQMRAADMERLLGLFSAVRVICFLRHQAPLLESASRLHTLWHVTASTEGFPEFVQASMRSDWLEWCDVGPFYRAARSDAEVELLSFAAACRSGSVVRYFLERIGMAGFFSGDVRSNESLGRAATLALLLRNRGELEDPLGRQAFIRFVRRLFPGNHQSLFTAALLEHVVSRFEAGNRRLATAAGFDLNDEAEAFRGRQSLVGWELTADERRLFDSALRRRNRFPLFALACDYMPRMGAGAALLR